MCFRQVCYPATSEVVLAADGAFDKTAFESADVAALAVNSAHSIQPARLEYLEQAAADFG